MIPTIKIKEKIKEIGGRAWHPIEIARVNDQVVRIALFKGEYHWHQHKDKDELFYVLKGDCIIQLKYPHKDITTENIIDDILGLDCIIQLKHPHKEVILHEGEMAVVPKGVYHCAKSSEGAYMLMFEPYELKSKGD